MDYDRQIELKEEIIPRWEDILRQITSPAKKAGEYVCPFCGHGKGGDGIRPNPKSGKYGLKCFGCDFSGNILDLLGRVEGLDSFPDQLKRAGFLLGIDTEERELASRKVAQKKPENERSTTPMNTHTDSYTQTDKTSEKKPEKDNTPYYLECAKRLSQIDNYLSSRGISTQTAKKLGLGYDPDFKIKGGSWGALIIPVTKYSYVGRNTDTASEDRYRNRGDSQLYHSRALWEATAPIVITEGELDAISVIEVGGEAVGLGSTSNIGKLEEAVKDRKPAQPLILALDNDKAGREASEELSKKLEALGVSFYVFNLYGDYKDANEALVANREDFSLEVLGLEDHIAKLEEDALEAERKEYLQTTALAHINDFIDGIQASVDTPATPTGYDLLDLTLDGGLYEGLYIIGAITSLGKTTLTLQLADQIARDGRDVIIFSLEMARAELMSKSISRLTYLDALSRGVDVSNAKTARGITSGSRYDNYSDLETTIIFDSIGKYRDYYARHIYIHEGIGDIGVDQIRATVAKHIRLTGEAPVVIVDYLQILAPYNDRASDKQNTDRAVVELKRISRDFKLPVIAVSSLNRTNYNEEIKLEAMKESGGIEYGSDVVLGLQLAGAGEKGFNATEAKAKNPREVELVVLKNRNGRTGDKIIYQYYPLFNYFVEDLEKNVIQTTKTKRNKY